MRLWGFRRRHRTGEDEFPAGTATAWDEQLSASLDDELDEHEAVALEDALVADPALAVRLDELAAVRGALGALGELRAPRPFTIEAPAAPARRAPGGLEMVFRMGAVAAAVAFAVVFAGDIAGLGGRGVEGWGIASPLGGGASEQASDAPQAAAPVAFREAATAVATQAAIATATLQPAETQATQQAAAIEATPEPTAALAAAAETPAPTPEPPAVAEDGEASPTSTTDSAVAARTSDDTAADEAPAASEAEAATTPSAEPAAAEETADDSPAAPEDASEAATPAPEEGEAAPAAAAAPTAEATAPPAVQEQPMQVDPADGDEAGRALRRAEQWLLVAAVALAGLALALGLRRRGDAA